MAKSYWLVKTEPYVFSWDKFVADGKAVWDGVRNFTARNNLRAMKVGDVALFYHSNEGKEVVGLARVEREAYPDPTAKGADWSAVDFVPIKPLGVPVTLKAVKEEPSLAEMALVRRSRLSVQPVLPEEFAKILAMGKTKLSSR
jgi:predicted RNA-binding protein with PUA-like domain